jgi:hypothetical protein
VAFSHIKLPIVAKSGKTYKQIASTLIREAVKSWIRKERAK